MIMQPDTLSDWRISKRTALLLFAVPFVGLLLIAAAHFLSEEVWRKIDEEDGPIESLQFAGLFVSSLVSGAISYQLLRNRQLIAAVLCFLVRHCDAEGTREAHRGRGLRGDPVDLIDRQAVERCGARVAKASNRVMMKLGQPCDEESAVPSGGAARDDAGVHTSHPRAESQQLVRGGKPGAAEADHAHVGDHIAVQDG